MIQKYTSAGTSMNKNHLPKTFSKIKNWKQGSINLDLGGGKYDNATTFLHNIYGCRNLILDPYNRTKKHNSNVLRAIIKNGGSDTVTCLNVLNVIAERDIRISLIHQAYDLLKSNGIAYFQIYEGNRSGVGCETKKDCYQNNLPCKEYISEIELYFNVEKITSNIIICKK